ncbi:RNA polymerase sigma factor [Isosphaeraceae bacterium EP7]
MATGQWAAVVGQVNRLWTAGTSAGQTETQLLDRFATGGDESAFEALVARHGSMVHGVCRRVLRDPNDADDAFQATFLVLARKAGSLRDGALLGNWLYGVARRVSTRARADAEARRRREADAGRGAGDEPDASQAAQRRELAEMVQAEVDRLPSASRAVVVLCDLSGCSHEEAASRLGLPLGTVKSRHFRARTQLKTRLHGRGLAPEPALALLVTRTGARLVPPALLETTARAACAYAAGRLTLAGLATSHAVSLAQGVLTSMLTNQLTLAATITLSAALLTVGAGVYAQAPAGAAKADGAGLVGDGSKKPQATPTVSVKTSTDFSKTNGSSIAELGAIAVADPKSTEPVDSDPKPVPAEKPRDIQTRLNEAHTILDAMMTVQQSGANIDLNEARLWLEHLQQAIKDRDAPEIAEAKEQLRIFSLAAAKSNKADDRIRVLQATSRLAHLERKFENEANHYQFKRSTNGALMMPLTLLEEAKRNAGAIDGEEDGKVQQALTVDEQRERFAGAKRSLTMISNSLETLRQAAADGVEIPKDQLRYWLDRHKKASKRYLAFGIKQRESDAISGPLQFVDGSQVEIEGGQPTEEAKYRRELATLTAARTVASMKQRYEKGLRAFDDLQHLMETGKYDPSLVRSSEPPYGPAKVETPPLASADVNGATQAKPTGPEAGGDMESGGGGGYGGGGETSRSSVRMSVPQVGTDEASKELGRRLGEAVTMQFPQETPLEDVLKYLKTATSDVNFKGLTFYIDPEGLADAERTTTSPVSIDLDGFPLRTSLKLLLKQLGLVYMVRDGLVIITHPDRVEELDHLLGDDGFSLPSAETKGGQGGAFSNEKPDQTTPSTLKGGGLR